MPPEDTEVYVILSYGKFGVDAIPGIPMFKSTVELTRRTKDLEKIVKFMVDLATQGRGGIKIPEHITRITAKIPNRDDYLATARPDRPRCIEILPRGWVWYDSELNRMMSNQERADANKPLPSIEVQLDYDAVKSWLNSENN